MDNNDLRGVSMAKTILFSPLGGTDPISENNCRDGSMLHICRHYKPDLVYLYMSKEVFEKQKKDSRYTYCIDKLSKLINHQIKYEIIERPELVNVHEFDYFYNELRSIISEIYKGMNPEDKLLINVSSGTPSMKSCLIVLKTMGEIPCNLIQVSTPTGKMNDHTHNDLDIELLWEMNDDNKENSENRCFEIACPTLAVIKNEEIIKTLIEKYDYEGALAVAKNLSIEYTQKYIDLIELALYRIELDFRNVDILSRKTGFDFTPIKDGDKRKYYEYVLNLGVKIKQAKYADFIRAISPIIVDLYAKVVDKHLGINVYNFCPRVNGIMKWNEERLRSDEKGIQMLDVWNDVYKREGFKYGFIKSDHLRYLIEYMVNDAQLIRLVSDLRNVEEKVRNMAAHQIVSVTENTINQLTGFSPIEIYNMIKKMFGYTNLNVKSEFWNSYESMNEEIIAKIGNI